MHFVLNVVMSGTQVEAEGTDTVGDLKKKILDTQSHPIENQKLTFSGMQFPNF